jgi:hypothetical protein
MNTPSRIAGVLLLGAAAGLTGCRSSRSEYWLQVRNNAGSVVSVQYVLDDGGAHYRPLTDFWAINPAEQVPMPTLRTKEGNQVFLQAEARDNPAFPARLPMQPGLTIVNITREEPSGKIKLERVPRN